MKRESEGSHVVILDDNLAISDSLRSILSSHFDIEVIGVASNSVEAVARVEEHHPDVVLMDAQTPGFEATRSIKQRVPETKSAVHCCAEGPSVKRRLVVVS